MTTTAAYSVPNVLVAMMMMVVVSMAMVVGAARPVVAAWSGSGGY
jgi:hypothetical protein